MTYEGLVYKTVFDRCIKAGCTEIVATNAANGALTAYKENRFVKPSKLIGQAVVDAKKLIKKKVK